MISYRTMCPIRVADECGHGTVGVFAGIARGVVCVFSRFRGRSASGGERVCGSGSGGPCGSSPPPVRVACWNCHVPGVRRPRRGWEVGACRAACVWKVVRPRRTGRGRSVPPDPLTHAVRDCHYSPLFCCGPAEESEDGRDRRLRQVPHIVSESYDYPPHLESGYTRPRGGVLDGAERVFAIRSGRSESGYPALEVLQSAKENTRITSAGTSASCEIMGPLAPL